MKEVEEGLFSGREIAGERANMSLWVVDGNSLDQLFERFSEIAVTMIWLHVPWAPEHIKQDDGTKLQRLTAFSNVGRDVRGGPMVAEILASSLTRWRTKRRASRSDWSLQALSSRSDKVAITNRTLSDCTLSSLLVYFKFSPSLMLLKLFIVNTVNTGYCHSALQ
ncbi:hypothetical protein B0H13DRAFT_1866862 [Mycena leptocephala]|nr:hypothetical protein B0H13DRAFT_1866862 [Mycena leptocephala]